MKTSRLILFTGILIMPFIFLIPISVSASLQLNIFPQETYVDFDQPGVNGINIDYQLFGSQTGPGAATAKIHYYYCSGQNPFSSQCVFLDTRIVSLSCNPGPICFPPVGVNTHFIDESLFPDTFESNCYSGDWYIVGIVDGNDGTFAANTNPTSPVEFAHSRPDLQPYSIELLPDVNNPGQFIINCVVANFGPCPSAASHATIWLTPNAGVPILLDVPILPSLTGAQVSGIYDNLTPGETYNATLTVDVYNAIDETDEGNNVGFIPNFYTFPLPPEISGFSPPEGTVLSQVTITRNGFANINMTGTFNDVNKVLIDNKEALILYQDADIIQIQVPFEANSDVITLETIYGTSSTSTNEFIVTCSPSTADIESGDIPFPWLVLNPDGDVTFELHSNGGANNSNNSVRINNREYSTIDEEDYIVIPNVCIDNSPGWKLRMDVAYTYYDDGASTKVDNLFVFDYETNNILAFYSGIDIATAPPQTSVFEPQSNQWGTIEVDLTSYVNQGQTELYLVIGNQNQNGNALYLDNIRVEQSSPLPIELLTFEAEKIENTRVELYWVTALEKNNDYFVVERSNDGKDFNEIGRINGSGTTEETSTYNFIDYHPVSGNNYYRLLQVDYDGTSSYSNIEIVKIDPDENNAFIFPNPGYGKITITNLVSDGEINIYNYEGQLLSSHSIYPNSPHLDLSKLSNGNYYLRLIQNEKVSVHKYIKIGH